MDISPKTKDGIVDINIHEESHVKEILQELIQRFGDEESVEQLKLYLIEKIQEKAGNKEVLFYEFNYKSNAMVNVSTEYALSRIKIGNVWQVENENDLHIYPNITKNFNI